MRLTFHMPEQTSSFIEPRVLTLCRELASRGDDVQLLCREGLAVESVATASVGKPVSLRRDAYVAVDDARFLSTVPHGRSRVLWLTRPDLPASTPADWDAYTDAVVYLSESHKQHLLKNKTFSRMASSSEHRSYAVDLPFDLRVFRSHESRVVSRRMVWYGPPENGLHLLLSTYPRVEREVTGATLIILGDVNEWIARNKISGGAIGDRARYVAECLRRLGTEGKNGIYVRKIESEKDLVDNLNTCCLFPYTAAPLRYTDAYAPHVMAASLAGCDVMLPDVNALREVYPHARCLTSDHGSWATQISDCLKSGRGLSSEEERAGRRAAHLVDSKSVADRWTQILLEVEKSKTVVIKGPAQPVSPRQPGVYGFSLKEPIDSLDGAKVSVTVWSKDEDLIRENCDQSPSSTKDLKIQKPPPPLSLTEKRRGWRSEWTPPSIRPGKKSTTVLRVAVVLGRMGAAVHGTIDVANMLTSGFATGTVSGFLGIAWGLAERGHEVHAFCECKETVLDSKYGDASFYHLDQFPGDGVYDVVISVNEPDLLKSARPQSLRVVAMYLNDFSWCKPGFDDFVDLYVCPSQEHRKYLARYSKMEMSKSAVVPIGTNLELFKPASKYDGSITYCSSPDRGLHHLLRMFPKIKERVQQANLKIFYRFDPWFEDVMRTQSVRRTPMWRLATEIQKDVEKYKDQGVTLVGPVSPAEMAERLCRTDVFAYPCDPKRFTEGYSVATLDACAAGCVPIISDADVLPSVYGSATVVLPRKFPESDQEWIDCICSALVPLGRNERQTVGLIRARALAHAHDHSRQKVAERWERLILERLGL